MEHQCGPRSDVQSVHRVNVGNVDECLLIGRVAVGYMYHLAIHLHLRANEENMVSGDAGTLH